MKTISEYFTGISITGLLLGALLLSPVSAADTIDVQIKGFDDGVTTTRQQDYKEAVLFAKRDAIERAGVRIKSMTTVADFVVNAEYIESRAEAVLLPGFTVIDIGYQPDGTYLVILSGKVRTTGASLSGPGGSGHPSLAAIAAAPGDFVFYIGDRYGYHDITDAYFIADDRFVINYAYKHGQIVLTDAGAGAETLTGAFTTDESTGTVTLSFRPDGTAAGSWKTFISGGALNIEKK